MGTTDRAAYRAAGLPTSTAHEIRANPFRVLGLDADASPAAVRRAADRASAALRLGAVPPESTVRPLTAPPDEAAVREAAHRLRDPAARLVAELTWFPVQSPGAPDGERAAAAAHTRVVRTLLDLLEPRAATGRDSRDGPDGPDGPDGNDGPAWTAVLDALAEWLSTPAAVPLIRARANILGVGAIRGPDDAALLAARVVLAPWAEALLDRARAGRRIPAPALDGLASAALPTTSLEQIRDQLTAAAADRLDDLIDEHWPRAQAEPGRALEVGESLADRAEPWVDLLRTAGEDAVTAVQLADRTADVVSACAVNFLADTDEPDRYRRALSLLQRALRICEGDELFDRISGFAAEVEAVINLRPLPGPCVLCGREEPLQQGVPVPVPLDGPQSGVRSLGDQHDLLLLAPRCTSCVARAVTLRRRRDRLLRAFAAVIWGCWIPLLLGAPWWVVPVALTGIAVWAVLTWWAYTRQDDRTVAAVTDHPMTVSFVERGWRLRPVRQYLWLVPDPDGDRP